MTETTPSTPTLPDDVLGTLTDDDAVVTVHGPAEPGVAAALDTDGVVVGVELVDAAAMPNRDGLTYRLLHDDDRERAVVGARFVDGSWRSPETAAEAVTLDVQAQLDALTALICEAQLGAAPAPGAWAALLAGMVDRGAARAETIDGAHQTWHVLEDDEHAALRARLDGRGGHPAAVEDLLDASDPAADVPAPRRTRRASGDATGQAAAEASGETASDGDAR